MIAPSGGFWPRGLVGRQRRVGVLAPAKRGRRRRLEQRRVGDAVVAAICRNGVMSSRIQNARPCVPTTMSSSLITRSRIDVAGMFSRSDCQWSPSSNEKQTCVSLPANSSPRRFGILAHHVDRCAVGNPVHDLRPRLAAVVGAVDVRRAGRPGGSCSPRRTPCARRCGRHP